MAKAKIYNVEIEDIKIPLRVYTEWRGSTRISIGKKYAILRVPHVLGGPLISKQISWASKWLRKQFAKNPELKERFVQKVYSSNEPISIEGKSYFLQINKENRKTNTGKVVGNLLQLKLNEQLSGDQEQNVIQKLVRRLIAADNLDRVTRRIHKLNEQHFNKTIKSVRLKYNTSNWGSCSSTGNVNISTRLLCAPEIVQDYVFIHELAHLKELNHSARFWKIVEEAMPEYRQQEKWLKEYGETCVI